MGGFFVMNFDNIKQPFVDLFPGDQSFNPQQRQTPGVLYSFVKATNFDNIQLLHFNQDLSQKIGLGSIQDDNDIQFLGGQYLPAHLNLYSTAYAGHQFGNWAGQLGDGRAILIGEVENSNIKTELQYKGAGATPYSRHADGRAVLRSSIREYLMSEAMFHLGVPTTRALSLVKSGEDVVRDMMYNGNPEYEDGAIVIRTAPTFLRFGHFELLASRNELETLKKLMDYTIEKYFPEVTSKDEPQKYIDWLNSIADKTIEMIVEWYRVGFVHGVMNTDNMSILGLTIDYGPFSFLDEYSLNFTPNTTDLPGRRYAFGKQGQIAQWNLWQLVNAVFPIIKDEKALQEILNNFGERFWKAHDEMMARKFGFDCFRVEDGPFFAEFQRIAERLSLDYTLFFNYLENLRLLKEDNFSVEEMSYLPIQDREVVLFQNFIHTYLDRISFNTISDEESIALMEKSNPKFVLRNYLLFECIEKVKNGDMTMFHQLWESLENPYKEIHPQFTGKRPDKFNSQPGCSTLSCSS